MQQRTSSLKSSSSMPDARYSRRRLAGFVNFLFACTIVAALIYGWSIRDERHLTPEDGVGYYLGIVGGTMMLILLLYPIRKRFRTLAWLGRVPSWFRVHMLFGILGPVLILFHSNFHLGSVNSSVALFSMLAVAASGLVGRFLYTRIHYGLYGRKTEAAETLQDAQNFIALVGEDSAGISELTEALQQYEAQLYRHHASLLSSLVMAATLAFREDAMRRNIVAEVKTIVRSNAQHLGWNRKERRRREKAAMIHLSDYFSATRKAAQFGVYERLFSLWHVLHLPLFYFLILTACIHVFAVHQY